LLSAVVLYIVSIGNVRGFAFALGLSTVIDVVIVFLFTKPLMSWLAGKRFYLENSKWSGLSRDRLAAKTVAEPTPARRTRPARPAVEEA
jgi:preprotein translocase subunit SecD